MSELKVPAPVKYWSNTVSRWSKYGRHSTRVPPVPHERLLLALILPCLVLTPVPDCPSCFVSSRLTFRFSQPPRDTSQVQRSNQ